MMAESVPPVAALVGCAIVRLRQLALDVDGDLCAELLSCASQLQELVSAIEMVERKISG